MYRSVAIRNKNYLTDVLSLWNKCLPMITPYYALKAYSDTIFIEQIATQYPHYGFEYASRSELDMVLEYNNPVLFSNPIKHIDDIKYSKENNRHIYVVDSIEEILKISKIDMNAVYIIRIQAHDTMSEIRFNNKFGVSPNTFYSILKRMYQENMLSSICGISYHVGSRCKTMLSHSYTFHSIFSKYMPIMNMFGLHIGLIDIGGGFSNANQLYDLRKLLRNCIDYCTRNNVKLIAEPGRLFSNGYLDVLTTITAIRKRIVKDKEVLYITINDSVYHTFQGNIYDQQTCSPILIPQNPCTVNNENMECIIFGQTCDSIDVICERVFLNMPRVGDMLLFENMGAYSISSSNGRFNGFKSARVI